MQHHGPAGRDGADGRSERLRERLVLVFSLFLPALLLGLGRGFTMPVLPVIARDEFMTSEAAAVLVAIAPMAGSAVATLPTGYFIDRIGRRKVLIAGPFITAVSSFLVVIATSYVEMLAYLVISGIALQMWQMGRLAAISDTGQASARGRMITGMGGLQRLGMLMGPLAGGLVGEFIGLRVPFIMYGAMSLLAAIPMILLIKESAPGVLARRRGEEAKKSDVDTSWKKLLTFPVIVLFIAQYTSNLARGGTVGNAGPFFIFAAFAYGVGPATLGAVSFGVALIGVPMTFSAGWIMDRFGRKRTVVPASASLGLALCLMAAVAGLQMPFFAFVVAFVWANLSISLMAGSMQTIGSDVAPPEARGKFFGVIRFIAEGGSVSNPGVFGVSAWAVALPAGYALGFALMGGSGIATALLVGLLLKETLRRESPGERSGARA